MEFSLAGALPGSQTCITENFSTHALRIGDNPEACRRMCAGGSAHEMWQGVMRFIMQSNALKPFKKESKRIIHYPKSKRKIKTSFQIMDKTRNKTGAFIPKIYATHFFVSGYEKG